MEIELRDIHKAFGSVRANAGISLRVAPGSVLGILGENGAGKSTLMRILSGFQVPDRGAILLDGMEVAMRSPADAIRRGIGMLHQDPLDFPPLALVDDFLLGSRGSWVLDRKGAARQMRELGARFGFELEAECEVADLSVGQRQQLEIVRLLWLGAQALILDEPTTGLSLPQREKLFGTIRALAAGGMTILFVSHKLEEIEALCDRAAVLREGRLVGEARPPFETARLVEMMFGREVPEPPPRRGVPGAEILAARGIRLESPRLQLRDVQLSVRAGEVVGLAGMEGSGQTLFLSACAGLERVVAGSIRVEGREMTGRAHREFRDAGVAYLPAARLEAGLVPGLSLCDHFTLAEVSRGRLFIDRRAAGERASSRIAAYNIKGRPDSPVEALSGGHQQRAMLALLRDRLALVLVEHPTRGLDIESARSIWSQLGARCAQGTAIVFVSSDLDEILRHSDRVLVFFAGRVSPSLPAASLGVEELGGLIGGKGWERFGEAAHA